MEMSEYKKRIFLNFFKKQFGRAENFLANDNLRMKSYGEDYCLIVDFTYENDICVFSTRSEGFRDVIVEYLNGLGYEVELLE